MKCVYTAQPLAKGTAEYTGQQGIKVNEQDRLLIQSNPDCFEKE